MFGKIGALKTLAKALRNVSETDDFNILLFTLTWNYYIEDYTFFTDVVIWANLKVAVFKKKGKFFKNIGTAFHRLQACKLK